MKSCPLAKHNIVKGCEDFFVWSQFGAVYSGLKDRINFMNSKIM